MRCERHTSIQDEKMVIQDILREKHVHLPRKEFIVNYKRQGAKVNKDVRREKKQQTWTNKVVLPTPLVPRTATVQVSISTLSGELDTSVGTRLCHFGQFLAGLRLLITWLVKRKYFHLSWLVHRWAGKNYSIRLILPFFKFDNHMLLIRSLIREHSCHRFNIFSNRRRIHPGESSVHLWPFWKWQPVHAFVWTKRLDSCGYWFDALIWLFKFDGLNGPKAYLLDHLLGGAIKLLLRPNPLRTVPHTKSEGLREIARRD